MTGPADSCRTALDATAVGPSLGKALGQDILELVPRLTLVMTLLFPGVVWFHRIYMRMLVVCGFVFPPLVHVRYYWITLFLLHFAVQNIWNWAASDNHQWLFSYWFLSLGIALGGRRPRQAMAESARLLIGLTFLAAVIRKLLTPDYLSGTCFSSATLIRRAACFLSSDLTTAPFTVPSTFPRAERGSNLLRRR